MNQIIIILIMLIPSSLLAQGRIEGKVVIAGGGGSPDSIALPGYGHDRARR
ncbi:MAG: hypothetical protein LC630_05990 [Bacteroidales bacterium]|nr:hypothetical protein [Bacteroidales bacterium]